MRLVITEVRRGLARRSTRVLITVAVGFIVALGLGVFLSSEAEAPSQADAIAGRNAYIDDCVGSGGFGGELPGRTIEELRHSCENSAGGLDVYADDKRFELTELWNVDENHDDGVLAVTALFLMIGALMAGATFIGGDWRHGTIGTLLTWEPRRGRVFLAKAAAVAGVAFAVGFLLQSLVSAAVLPAAIWRGTTEGADAEWFRDLVGALFRTSVLAAGAALIGYSIAMLGRNTSAAIGVAFGYFAVVEPVLRGLKPEWQRWLVGDNSTVVLFGHQLDTAQFERTLTEASILLAVYLALTLAVAGTTFSRRDVGA